MSSTMTTKATAEISIDAITVSELNPRKDIDEAALEELTRSVASLGVINPVTVRQVISDPGGGEGPGYLLIAGQRRLRAAEAAGLSTIPAIVLTGDEALDEGISVAENVIRSDLTPLEEANAYKVLLDQDGGGIEHVASLVGRSADTITERLRLLALPSTTQHLIGERRITLACAPWLAVIAEKHPALCDAVADLLVHEDEGDQRDFVDDPGSWVDSVLAEQVYAWSAGGWSDPICPRGEEGYADTSLLLAWLHPHHKLADAWQKLPAINGDEYNYRADGERRARKALLQLTEEDILQARAYGCLIELPARAHRSSERYYVTDPEWVDAFLGERVERYEPGDTSPPDKPTRKRADGGTENEEDAKQRRAAERDAAYAERVAARARNLDVGAAMTQYTPDLSLDEVKLLSAVCLHHYGNQAAYAYRLCEEHPVKTSKAGKETVQYPRGSDEARAMEVAAWGALDRAKTPKEAAAVALRLLVAHHLVDTTGLPQAETMGMQEAYELSHTTGYEQGTGRSKQIVVGKLLDKLATRLAPASVKKHRRAKATAEALAKKATAADDE